MPLTRLLLSGSLSTGHRVNLRIEQETINQILPELILNKDLVMDY